MAEPQGFQPQPFQGYGRELAWGPEAWDKFRDIGSPEFFNQLGGYRSRQYEEGPRAGWDYLLGQPRAEDDARFMEWMLRNLYSKWSSEGYPPGKGAPRPYDVQPSEHTGDMGPIKGDKILEKLLEQRRKLQGK